MRKLLKIKFIQKCACGAITSVSGRGPHGELILEACDKAAELAVIYADALIKELK